MAGDKQLNQINRLNKNFEHRLSEIETDEQTFLEKIELLRSVIGSYTRQRTDFYHNVGTDDYTKERLAGEILLDKAQSLIREYSLRAAAEVAPAPEVSLEAKKNIKELLETATSTAQAAVAKSLAKSLKEAPRILALEKFDTTLVAFQAQIGLIHARFENASDSEREDLMAAYTAAQTTYLVLTQLRDDYVRNTEQTPQAFAQSCLEVLASEENKELNKPRGDWSIGRILGELIRSLKSLVFENATAPRFFKTTTQQKADDIAAAAQEFGSNGPRTGG
jgi:hypothetical protein